MIVRYHETAEIMQEWARVRGFELTMLPLNDDDEWVVQFADPADEIRQIEHLWRVRIFAAWVLRTTEKIWKSELIRYDGVGVGQPFPCFVDSVAAHVHSERVAQFRIMYPELSHVVFE